MWASCQIRTLLCPYEIPASIKTENAPVLSFAWHTEHIFSVVRKKISLIFALDAQSFIRRCVENKSAHWATIAQSLFSSFKTFFSHWDSDERQQTLYLKQRSFENFTWERSKLRKLLRRGNHYQYGGLELFQIVSITSIMERLPSRI